MTTQALQLQGNPIDWLSFWNLVEAQLRHADYAESSINVYRHVLRRFCKFVRITPGYVTRRHMHNYLHTLRPRDYSWSWLATNICVLRNAFDRIGGLTITAGIKTPKRPLHLPEILSHKEAMSILRAAVTPRDRLLLGLMYLCGLKVGETCSLKWHQVDIAHRFLVIPGNRDHDPRRIPIPKDLEPILREGVTRCQAGDHIFQGRREGRHLSTRMAAMILAKACRQAGIIKPVSCMTLRHSFAVNSLEAGASIRQAQVWLGHKDIDTTLRYDHCRLPSGVISQLDAAPPEADPLDAPSVLPTVFDEPLTVEPHDLPLTGHEPSAIEKAFWFYNCIKTSLRGHITSPALPGLG